MLVIDCWSTVVKVCLSASKVGGWELWLLLVRLLLNCLSLCFAVKIHNVLCLSAFQLLYKHWREKRGMRSSWVKLMGRSQPLSSRERHWKIRTQTQKCSRIWVMLHKLWKKCMKICKSLLLAFKRSLVTTLNYIIAMVCCIQSFSFWLHFGWSI